MERSRLGRTGPQVARVAFGAWAVGGHGWGKVDEEESVAAVRRAWELGIDLFDTADVYGLGHSEELLAKALGDARHEVVLATKVGVTWEEGRSGRDGSPDHIRRSARRSMERLGLDRIPLYQLHWPDPRTPIETSMREMRRLQQEGLVEHVGACNLTREEVERALTEVELVTLQAGWSVLGEGYQPGVVDLARREGISLLPFDVIHKGLLTGKFTPEARFGPDDVRSRDPQFQGERFLANLRRVEELRAVGAAHGRTPGQVAIRWVLEQPGVAAAIVGARTAAQTESNIGALGWSLDPREVARLAP